MSKNLDGKTLWRDTSGHRRWLTAEADALFAFYETDSIRPAGGFWTLDDLGKPLLADKARALHATSRMVHGFAIAHLLGRPGAADIVDHGMQALRVGHRDPRHGGYFWSFDDEGPCERDKLAYGHAFEIGRAHV